MYINQYYKFHTMFIVVVTLELYHLFLLVSFYIFLSSLLFTVLFPFFSILVLLIQSFIHFSVSRFFAEPLLYDALLTLLLSLLLLQYSVLRMTP